MVYIDLPQRASGLLMAKELSYFAKALESPEKPFLAIVGGAKVSDKILLIKNLLEKVDELIVCGGMAFTFKSKLEGVKIGKSLYDEAGSEKVQEITDEAKGKVTLTFPVDYITASEFGENPKEIGTATDKEGIPDSWMGLDAGKESRKLFRETILKAKTILWNGPPGVFEFEKFNGGSKSMLADCIEACSKGATVIVGGGDTATVCAKFGGEGKISHISTGGGASLELLEGKPLPGVTALSSK